MKLNKSESNERKDAGEGKKLFWKSAAVLGAGLAIAGCGSTDIENFVPIPGKKDASVTDARLDGKAALDSSRDFSKADGGVAKDGSSDYNKVTDMAPDALSDKGASDACVPSSGALVCSNTSAVASGWLALGSYLELKGNAYTLDTIYRVRFDGVETANGTSSAVISVLDSCGKLLKKDKIQLNSTKSFSVSGQQFDITLEGLYGGISGGDGAVQSGQAKLSAEVLCNLDAGVADSSLAADSKAKADSAPKADSKAPSDSKVAADSKPVADSKASADLKAPSDSYVSDTAKAHDSAVADLGVSPDTNASDSGLTADSTAAPDSLVSDSLSGSDGMASCPSTAYATFSGMVYNAVKQAVGGYDFYYKGMNAGGDALFDIKCGSAAIISGKACPEDTATSIPMPQDGKKIVITPHSVAAAQSKVSIVVGKP